MTQKVYRIETELIWDEIGLDTSVLRVLATKAETAWSAARHRLSRRRIGGQPPLSIVLISLTTVCEVDIANCIYYKCKKTSKEVAE